MGITEVFAWVVAFVVGVLADWRGRRVAELEHERDELEHERDELAQVLADLTEASRELCRRDDDLERERAATDRVPVLHERRAGELQGEVARLKGLNADMMRANEALMAKKIELLERISKGDQRIKEISGSIDKINDIRARSVGAANAERDAAAETVGQLRALLKDQDAKIMAQARQIEEYSRTNKQLVTSIDMLESQKRQLEDRVRAEADKHAEAERCRAAAAGLVEQMRRSLSRQNGTIKEMAVENSRLRRQVADPAKSPVHPPDVAEAIGRLVGMRNKSKETSS
jgi:chromosome segregation ATPase